MKKTLLFLFISLYSLLLYSDENIYFSRNQMEEDVDYFFHIMKNNHANLYEKYPEQVFDSIHTTLKGSLLDSLSLQSFTLKLASINKYFDEHACIYPFYSNSKYGFLSPIQVIKEQIYLGNNAIIQINNIDGNKIGKLLDGLVSWTATEKHKIFLQQLYLAYLLKQYYKLPPPYVMKLYDPITKEMKDSILQHHDLIENLKVSYSYNYEHHSPPISQQLFYDENIAILYYNTSDFKRNIFSEIQMDSIFEHTTSDFFRKVNEHNIDNIFIDVSENGGGSGYVHNYITRFLKYDSCEYDITVYMNNNIELENIPDFMREHLLLMKKKDIKKRNIIEANSKGYQGNVFIIMGVNTFSSGFEFCDRVKRANIGLLVGEASGQRNPYAGNVYVTYTPNSHIEMWCPLTYDIITPFFTDNNGFLQPDIPYTLDLPLGLDDYEKIIKLSKGYKN